MEQPSVKNSGRKPNKVSHSRRIARYFTVGIVLIALGAFGAWYVLERPPTNNEPVTQRQSLESDGNLNPTDDEGIITRVVEKAAPSVVSITTRTQVASIFGTASQAGAGSGVIVSEDGYIITNKHVVADIDALRVVTSEGRIFEDVSVVGTDPLNDIAYLKIKSASGLTPAELGDSSTIRVGQGVIAIGNSLGQYQNTVTSGIISGKGRPVTAQSESGGGSIETLTDLLQTDAAINPGNSGGPLLNRAGQVIGINTAVAADAQGIGFAIPINATKGILKSVQAGKGVQRAYLGLRYVPITAEVAEQYDLNKAGEGAYVTSNRGAAVQSGGPADQAGIKDGDIIMKINGLLVGPQGGVSSLIGEYAPGDTVEITVERGGRELTLKATLGAYPDI